MKKIVRMDSTVPYGLRSPRTSFLSVRPEWSIAESNGYERILIMAQVVCRDKDF